MLVAEIVNRKFFISDFMHGATRVCYCANFVSISFFPPIQRGCHIKPNNDHAQVFSMVSTGIAQACSKVVVVGTHTILLVTCADNMFVICMAAVFAKKQTIFLIIPVLTMRAAKALSLLAQLFFGFRMPRSAGLRPPTSTFSIFIIRLPPDSFLRVPGGQRRGAG